MNLYLYTWNGIDCMRGLAKNINLGAQIKQFLQSFGNFLSW